MLDRVIRFHQLRRGPVPFAYQRARRAGGVQGASRRCASGSAALDTTATTSKVTANEGRAARRMGHPLEHPAADVPLLPAEHRVGGAPHRARCAGPRVALPAAGGGSAAGAGHRVTDLDRHDHHPRRPRIGVGPRRRRARVRRLPPAARTASPRRAGPDGACASSATPPTGTGTGAAPGSPATPRWWRPAPTCAWRSSAPAPPGPATRPGSPRPPASPHGDTAANSSHRAGADLLPPARW